MVCTDSMGHSAGAHATLKMLDGMLDSFGQGLSRAAQSKAEQRRTKLYAAR